MDEESTWRSDLTWGALAVLALGYEVYTLRANKLDWTLTRTTRRAFRVKHPYGKAAFAISWGWFATWMMRHILEADDPIDVVLNALKGGGEDGETPL